MEELKENVERNNENLENKSYFIERSEFDEYEWFYKI
jgi:hypothetical protein